MDFKYYYDFYCRNPPPIKGLKGTAFLTLNLTPGTDLHLLFSCALVLSCIWCLQLIFIDVKLHHQHHLAIKVHRVGEWVGSTTPLPPSVNPQGPEVREMIYVTLISPVLHSFSVTSEE